ncbi:oocyte-secreted protein 3 isoform X1 [Equus asinus]|uniref:oocyte-secreted protein 3 isoform X1 n=1 Tax=Equus asinus TaxID=9793 RepID=UPI0038F7FEF1
MFWAVVEPTLLGQGHFLHSDEVSLGIGCPVTNITSQGYEFNYLVTECGIQKEVFSYGVIFYSALHYNIINKGVTGKIPLMCIVSSSPFLDDTPGTTNNNLTKSQDGLPSDNSCPSWTLSNTCLFGLPWIPYFQDSSELPFNKKSTLLTPSCNCSWENLTNPTVMLLTPDSFSGRREAAFTEVTGMGFATTLPGSQSGSPTHQLHDLGQKTCSVFQFPNL